jgi:acetylornithine deacetylase/succinyl-diaminopimelate desuccinylase-like protein
MTHGLSDRLAHWTSALVRIPSVNPMHAGPKAGTPGERAIALALAGWLEGFGARVEVSEVADGRPNVYGLVPGRTERLVVLDVHTDTVSVEHMVEEPFDGRIEDGCVWGRGALDTKASLGVILALLERWAAAGLRPEPSLLVVGTISEEGGGMLGAIGFREWGEDRGLRPEQIVVSEPTRCVPIYGHKGGAGYEVAVRGEAAHSSRPELGRSAIVAAAKAVLALQDEHDRLQTEEPLTEVGVGSINVGLINGGTAGNIVPDLCTFTVGRRVCPGEDAEAVAAALRRLIEEAVAPCPAIFTPIGTGVPSAGFYQPPDAPVVRTLAEATGSAPAVAPYGTNALRYVGFAQELVVFGPGSIDDAHKATECVAISELERCAAAFEAWLRPG